MTTAIEYRTILPQEAARAAEIEQSCFPPHEACPEEAMRRRVETAPDLFLVAIEKTTGEMAGYLNGLATDETAFRDEFFTDAALHNPDGETVMLLGLCVCAEYRRQGIASELMRRYADRERARGRRRLLLTCLEDKVGMYLGMGYRDLGLSGSVWGGEAWHEMVYIL